MRIAYIVMAYKDPQQIDRLVKAMNHEAIDFYIHVDAKFDIKPFLFLKENRNVYFFKKNYVIYWAAWNFTRTLLLCIHEIIQTGIPYEFVASFSGQDYPLKSNEYIVDYHLKNIGCSFFSLEEHHSEWWTHAISRVKKYHLTNYNFKGRYKLQDIMNKVLPERNFPFYQTLYGGPRATWWTMSSDAARYVSERVLSDKKLQRFCNFTWCPDEFLIPTILMNSPFKDSVINDSGRYIDWSSGGANPKILTTDDFDNIMNSGKLYARKFDLSVDSEILDRIDAIR